MKLYMIYRKYEGLEWQMVKIFQREHAAIRKARALLEFEEKQAHMPASYPRREHRVVVAHFAPMMNDEALPRGASCVIQSLADFIGLPF